MATFGDLSAGDDSFPATNDRALITKFTLAEDADATLITLRFHSTSAAGANAKAMIYADSGGTPDALVLVTSGLAVPAGGGLLDFSISQFLAAADYWLGGVTSDSQPAWQVDFTGGIGLKRREAHTYATPADPWGTDSGTSVSSVNVYVTYTSSVGVPPGAPMPWPRKLFLSG